MKDKLKYKTFYITTLGCSKNTVDSEILRGKLQQAGMQWTQPDDCEVLIINTCGFILDAKEESIDAIMDAVNLKNEGKIKKLIVMGCLVERYHDELQGEITEVDSFHGVEPFEQIMAELAYDNEGARELLTPSDYAYLKSAEGCDNTCSFCAIPGIRGKQHSKTIPNLLDEARYLSSLDVKELIIIAQDTTRYGTDIYGERKLAELLDELLKLKLFPRVRLMYTNPDFWDRKINKLFEKYDEICPYVDLPVQHASNRILDLMNRRSGQEKIRSIVEKLRSDVPEIALRTTVMVGFPGETEDEFYQLLDFIEEMEFERLGAFTYSEEEGTQAARFDDSFPQEEKDRRLEMIMSAQYEITSQFARNQVGKVIDMIVDRRESETAIGRTIWDAPEVDCNVLIDNNEVKTGNIYPVKIIESRDFDLIGTLHKEEQS